MESNDLEKEYKLRFTASSTIQQREYLESAHLTIEIAFKELARNLERIELIYRRGIAEGRRRSKGN